MDYNKKYFYKKREKIKFPLRQSKDKNLKYVVGPIIKIFNLIDRKIFDVLLNKVITIRSEMASRKIIIVAHRGGFGRENILSAFKKVVKTNEIQGVECDVVFTKDNIPVISHDNDISKEVSKKQRPARINQMTLKEVKKLSIIESNKKKQIPTLRETLNVLKKNVEIVYLHDKISNSLKDKEREQKRVERFVEDIKNSEIEEKIVVMVESGDLSIWKEFSKDVSLLRCWSGAPWEKDRFKIEDSLNKGMNHIGIYDTPNQLKFPGDLISRLGFKNLGHFISFWPEREYIKKFQKKGAKFVVFTINDITIMKKYINLGFDAIGTDNPSVLASILNNKKRG
jgi:glycerophosphoryl diester phosphodiesterase